VFPCGVSLQLQLRCMMHMELAKCEEDVDHVATAMENVKKVSSQASVLLMMS